MADNVFQAEIIKQDTNIKSEQIKKADGLPKTKSRKGFKEETQAKE